ncbi:Uncharacterised protein [Klebsiella pneumoniae]|nr:Uncharacterised protein [Klebsiella pneumoniae]
MAEQQRKTFQFGPDVVPVILFKGELRAGQKGHRLAQLFPAQAREGVAEQLTAVLPDPMFIKQRAQRRVRRLALEGNQQQQLPLQSTQQDRRLAAFKA